MNLNESACSFQTGISSLHQVSSKANLFTPVLANSELSVQKSVNDIFLKTDFAVNCVVLKNLRKFFRKHAF